MQEGKERKGRKENKMREVTQKKEGSTPDRRPGCDPEVQDASVGARHYLLAICCCVRFGRSPDWPGLKPAGQRGGASKPGYDGVCVCV